MAILCLYTALTSIDSHSDVKIKHKSTTVATGDRNARNFAQSDVFTTSSTKQRWRLLTTVMSQVNLNYFDDTVLLNKAEY